MIFRQYLNETGNVWAENRLLKFAVLVTACSTIIYGFFTYRAVTSQKIIIYPVGYSGQIEIEGEKINHEYLAYLSRTIFDLLLNYTPSTIKPQYEILLSMMAPSAYPRYHKQFQNFIQEAGVGKLVSVFLIKKLTFQPEKKQVVASGSRLFVLEGSRVVEEKQRTYVIRYEIGNGKFLIREIGEKKALARKKKKEVS